LRKLSPKLKTLNVAGNFLACGPEAWWMIELEKAGKLNVKKDEPCGFTSYPENKNLATKKTALDFTTRQSFNLFRTEMISSGHVIYGIHFYFCQG